jgi:flagella basal body P-ring formation protein FlgA
LRVTDVAKPDLVQRDGNVTLIYQAAGLYLTVRGKSLDSGAEGDTVNVLNLQSNHTIAGVVVGRDQVRVAVATPRIVSSDLSTDVASAGTAPVAVADGSTSPVALKAE